MALKTPWDNGWRRARIAPWDSHVEVSRAQDIQTEVPIKRRPRREPTLQSLGWVRIRPAVTGAGVFEGVTAKPWSAEEILQLRTLMAAVNKPSYKAFRLVALNLGTGRAAPEVEWKWLDLHRPPVADPCLHFFSGIITTLKSHLEAVRWCETVTTAKRLRAEAALLAAEQSQPAYDKFEETEAVSEELQFAKSQPAELGIGMTAIELAVLNGHRSSVRVLLAAGAVWSGSVGGPDTEVRTSTDSTSAADTEPTPEEVETAATPEEEVKEAGAPDIDRYGWDMKFMDRPALPAHHVVDRGGKSTVHGKQLLTSLRGRAMAAGITVQHLNSLDEAAIADLLGRLNPVVGPMGADGLWQDTDVSAVVAGKLSKLEHANRERMIGRIGSTKLEAFSDAFEEDLTPALRVELAGSLDLSGGGGGGVLPRRRPDDVKVLLFFYQQCAPDLARDEKVRAVIKSFRKKAQQAGAPRNWRQLMYSQLTGKYGVSPPELWAHSRQALVVAAQQTAAVAVDTPASPASTPVSDPTTFSASIPTSIPTAASFRCLILRGDFDECVSYLYRLNKAQPDWPIDERLPPHGTTALHWAAAAPGAEKVVGLLLEAGANTNVRGEDGLTPLQLAASVQTAELLLDYGADPSRIGRSGTAVGRRLARVFRAAKELESDKLADSAEVDASSNKDEQISDEDMAAKIAQYECMEVDDLDFDSLSEIGSIATLLTLLKVPKLASLASQRLEDTLATPITDPEIQEQFHGMAKVTAEGILRVYGDDSLDVSGRAALVIKAASQPALRDWFWHGINVDDSRLSLLEESVKLVMRATNQDQASSAATAMTVAESVIDVLSELILAEKPSPEYLGGLTDRDWKICEIPALEKYLAYVLGHSESDPKTNVVAELDAVRRRKIDLGAQAVARLKAEKDEADASGGGRIIKLVNMGYTVFEATDVVTEERQRIEAEAAALAEKAAAIDEHLQPHLLACGLGPEMTSRLIADLCSDPAKHVGCRCSQTGDMPIVGTRYTKLPGAEQRELSEAKQKLARADRQLARVLRDKVVGASRRVEAEEAVESARARLIEVQCATELASSRTTLESADLDGGDLSEAAQKALSSEQKRDYRAVGCPDLQKAVRYYLSVSKPLKIGAALAAWLWELEAGGFGLRVDERPIDPATRLHIVQRRERERAEVGMWRARMAAARFKLQQDRMEIEVARREVAQKQAEKDELTDAIKQNPPSRFVPKPDRELVRLGALEFPKRGGKWALSAETEWGSMSPEERANKILDGFTEESWPATAMEAALAAGQPLLTGPRVMYDSQLAGLRESVGGAESAARQAAEKVTRLAGWQAPFRWVERAAVG